MNIKDIIKKIKSLFSYNKTKKLESNRDMQFRTECEKDGRLKDYEDYLNFKKIALYDIDRFKKYIEEGRDDIDRWRYNLKSKQRQLEFIRPNNQKDIEERNYWRENFYNEFLKVIPENSDLRFHGTSIYNTKAILEYGGIFSSVDINDGFMASTDLTGEISAANPKTLNRVINGWFADFGAYIAGLPCGCIFALHPKSEKDNELKQYDAMQSVDFRKNPEQLYGIFTSTENIPNIRTWLENAGFSSDLAYTFSGFLDKIKSDNQKPQEFKQSLVVDKEIEQIDVSRQNVEQENQQKERD